MKKETVAKMIDHTLLAPTAGIRDIVKLCTQAEAYHFASVCINPHVGCIYCHIVTSYH